MTPTAGEDILHGTLRRCSPGLLAAGALSCFVNLLQLVMPLYSLQVYDRVLNSRSVDTLTMLTILAIGGLSIYAILEYLRGRILLVLAARVSWYLNAPTLCAAVQSSLRGGGGQGGQPSRDLNDLRLFISGPVVTLPLDIAWTPLFLLALFMLHPVYGGIAAGAAGLLVGLGFAVDMASRRPMAAANAALAQSFPLVGVAVRNAEVIEAMGMLPAIALRWHRAQARALALLDEGSRRGRAVAAASKAVRLGLQVTMIAAGVLLVLDNAASPGSIIAASIIMGRTLAPFEQLIEGWRQWAFALAAWRRVREALAKAGDRRQSVALPPPNGRLTVENLGFIPPGCDRPVVRGVSFAVEPGEVLGVIGPSASGKSTLARLLVGIWEPSAGGIYLDGNNVFLWERAGFGRAVGYLPQAVMLLDGTVRDNIARLGDADPAAVVAAARRADVHDMIGRLPRGYDTEIGDGGYALSGGQRQRIALARALFGAPRLIVLDEPNANLDHEGEAALLAAIAEARKGGAIVVLIAHRPSVIAVADKLVVMKDGTVDCFGHRGDVMAKLAPAQQVAIVPLKTRAAP